MNVYIYIYISTYIIYVYTPYFRNFIWLNTVISPMSQHMMLQRVVLPYSRLTMASECPLPPLPPPGPHGHVSVSCRMRPLLPGEASNAETDMGKTGEPWPGIIIHYVYIYIYTHGICICLYDMSIWFYMCICKSVFLQIFICVSICISVIISICIWYVYVMHIPINYFIKLFTRYWFDVSFQSETKKYFKGGNWYSSSTVGAERQADDWETFCIFQFQPK